MRSCRSSGGDILLYRVRNGDELQGKGVGEGPGPLVGGTGRGDGPGILLAVDVRVGDDGVCRCATREERRQEENDVAHVRLCLGRGRAVLDRFWWLQNPPETVIRDLRRPLPPGH
jgi:hypothetical protein